MFRCLSMRQALCVAFFLIFVTEASAATIPIVSGTITYVNQPFAIFPKVVLNLVTTIGTVTGTTNDTSYDQWFTGSPVIQDALLVSFSSTGGPTHLHLTVPDPIDIASDGWWGDFVWGTLTSRL